LGKIKKKKKKKKSQKYKRGLYVHSTGDLFKRGNVGLARLLIAVYNAGPGGISTYRLLHELGSTHHAKSFISRAVKEGLIKREKGEPPGPGQFQPVYNVITPAGVALLQRNLALGEYSKK
jgi:hypothetical protein